MGRYAVALCAVFMFVGLSARANGAGATFTTNAFTWAALYPSATTFALTASDVLKSDEVNVLPVNESQSPGQTLTFPSASTGIFTSFQLRSLTNWAFTYRNNLGGPFGTEGLSSGNAQAQNGTDWEIRFTGPQVLGFGFNLIDNESGADRVLVYGRDDSLLGTLEGITDKHTFVGVSSDVPIGRVVLDGDPVDFSAFNGLRLVPEPGAAAVLLAGLGVLACGRRGRGGGVSRLGR